MPLGSRGTHVGFAFYQTNYVLGNSWKELDANGTSRTFELFSITPLKRTLNNSSFIELYYRNKQLTDNIDIFDYKAEKSTHQGEIRWRGDYRDKNSINAYSVAHVFGNLKMQSADAKDGDYYGTEGGYQKTRADYMRIQGVSDNANLHFSITGQYAWTPLDSSEKMYIGGPNGVRAYPQGEAGGDHGVLGNVELRFRLKDYRWQIGPFIDYGWVRYNRNYAYSRTLSAAGISVLFSEPGKYSVKLDYGLPLSDSYSATAGKRVNSGQVWLQAIFKI